MNPADVAHSHDRIAGHWDSGAFPRENGMVQHERAVAFTDLRGSALDIGCGSSGRVIDLLLEQGFAPEGLDLSRRMLELARRRHPDLGFHHADICEWAFPRAYDFISAWDSIWHVPLHALEGVLRKVLAGLAPGGVAIFTIGGTDEPSETRDCHMGPPMYHATLGIPRTLEIVAETGSVCRHLEYDRYPELHVYLICQRT
jgi:SAM-dependent methyltransferase